MLYVLEFHSEVGMALAFKVGKQKDLPLEPLGWPKCGSYSSKINQLIENIDLNAAFRSFIGNHILTFLTFSNIFINI